MTNVEVAMSDLFENIDEATCAVDSGDAFSLVTTANTAVPFLNSMFSLTNANGLLSAAKLVFDQTLFDGTSVDFKVKYVTKFGNPVYHKLTYTSACTSQTVTANSNAAYSFTATYQKAETQVSSTKPQDDFTNSDSTNCPIYFKIVKSDGTDLDDGLENILSINSDGKVSVNSATYTGGTIDAKVQAVTPFGTPVFKPIQITSSCTSQTITAPSSAYAFELK